MRAGSRSERSSRPNWSPPSRARVSCGLSRRPSRRASVSRIESPTAMPTESLTCLKRSRSITITVGRMVESAVREGERGVEPVEEQFAVRQAGEVVVHGVVQQALLGGLELGHVGERADEPHHFAVGADHRARLEREPQVMPVRACAGGIPGSGGRAAARARRRARRGSGRDRAGAAPRASARPSLRARRACRPSIASVSGLSEHAIVRERPSPRSCRRRRSAPARGARRRRRSRWRRRRRRHAASP